MARRASTFTRSLDPVERVDEEVFVVAGVDGGGGSDRPGNDAGLGGALVF
jgi:hypothetical protein